MSVQYERRGTMVYASHPKPGRSRFLCECVTTAQADAVVAHLNAKRTRGETPGRQLVQDFLRAFRRPISRNEPINGSNAVEFLVGFYHKAAVALKSPHRSADGARSSRVRASIVS